MKNPPGWPEWQSDHAQRLFHEELRDRLFAQRIVLASGDLRDVGASELVTQLITLDTLGDEPITLQLENVQCGLDESLSIIDTIDLLGIPVHATASGRTRGPAIGILAVCERRALHRHASVELREPEQRIEEHHRNVEVAARHLVVRLERFCQRLSEATAKPLGEVAADFRRGMFLTAEEAVTYGLADEVLSPTARMYTLPSGRGSIGFQPRRFT